MIRTLSILSLLCFFYVGFAQDDITKVVNKNSIGSILAKDKHKNHIKLYVSNFFYPELTSKSDIFGVITPQALFMIWGQVGLGYQRDIGKRWSIDLLHNRWNDTRFFRGGLRFEAVYTNFNNRPTEIGFHSRANLQFYDIGTSYSFVKRKRHLLKGGLAASFQRGYSGYVDSIHYYSGGPYPHFEGFFHYEYKEYWGYVASASYDLNLLKNWFSIGADVRASRYFNYYNFTQVDVGMHLSVNF